MWFIALFLFPFTIYFVSVLLSKLWLPLGIVFMGMSWSILAAYVLSYFLGLFVWALLPVAFIWWCFTAIAAEPPNNED